MPFGEFKRKPDENLSLIKEFESEFEDIFLKKDSSFSFLRPISMSEYVELKKFQETTCNSLFAGIRKKRLPDIILEIDEIIKTIEKSQDNPGGTVPFKAKLNRWKGFFVSWQEKFERKEAEKYACRKEREVHRMLDDLPDDATSANGFFLPSLPMFGCWFGSLLLMLFLSCWCKQATDYTPTEIHPPAP